MKKNWIYFVIILIIISLDPKMVYWSSQGNFSHAILKLLAFQPTNKCISSFHLHILISTIHKCQIQKKEHSISKITWLKIPFTSTENIHEHHCTPFYKPFLGGKLVLHCQPRYEGLVGKSCFRPYYFLPFIETYMFLI